MSATAPNYNHTVTACFVGYITQAVINNFMPLLFVTFAATLGIDMARLSALITVNFVTQLVVDVLAGKFVDRIGYKPCIIAAHLAALAGLLALGRYPQKFYPRLGISIAVFPGTSRDDVFRGDERLVASKSVVGSIPVMIDDAVDSLMRWIGAKKPDYPPLVLREAIANALTHRDYSPDARGTQVHISVFTDRIEITNPGGLYGMVTHDVLASPHPVTGAPF